MKVTLLLAAIVCIAAAQDTPICQPVVDSETGATYDLSPLANDMIDYDIPNPEYTDYHFRINVCRPLIKACGTASTSMVCEYRTTSYAMNLGAVTTTPTLSNGAVQLIAVAGSKMSQFDFQCDETIPVGTPVYVDEVTSGGKATTYFTWATAAACPIYSGGLSGGDVFLILFFVGGFLYLAIGMVYKYKVKEQSGIYVVPNIEFWQALPGLCADGCRFTWQKLTGLCAK